MRTSISQLSPSQFAALSRATQWRGKKRGWVWIDYHKPRVNERDDEWFVAHLPLIEKVVRATVRRLSARGCFPHQWMEKADVAQDIRLYLLCRAQRIVRADNPEHFAYTLAWNVGCKTLGLYGGQRLSLSRSARMETKCSDLESLKSLQF